MRFDARPPKVAVDEARGGTSLIRAIDNYRELGSVTFLFAVHEIAEALVPTIVGLTIDRAIDSGRGGALALWLCLFLANYVVLTVSMRYSFRRGTRLSATTTRNYRLAISERIQQRAAARRDRDGSVATLTAVDAMAVGQACLSLPLGLSGAAGIAVAAVSILWYSIPLALVVVGGSVLVFVVSQALSGRIEKMARLQKDHAAEASGQAEDFIHGLRVLKGIRGGDAAWARYDAANGRTLLASLRLVRLQTTSDTIPNLSTAVLLGIVALVGSGLYERGDIPLGALLVALGQAQFLTDPLGRLSRTRPSLAAAQASLTRIQRFLTAPLSEPLVTVPDPLPNSIADAPGLYGLVFAERQARQAFVDNLRQREVPESAAAGARTSRRLVDGSEGFVFAGTVRDAIALSGGGLPPALVADESGVARILDDLPHGLDTHIGTDARGLSGGQRQRVIVARALAADREQLVLVDPTSALDSVTELNVAQGIRRLRKRKPTYVVTTSAGFLAQCDSVVFFGPDAVLSGRHQELSGSSRAYASAVGLAW